MRLENNKDEGKSINETKVSNTKYGDITVGEPVVAFRFVETSKGSLNYFKVTKEGSSKVHYLYEHEV